MRWAPHVTVAAIIERDGQFLMVEERVETYRVFNQPAGHLEPDESLIEAVIRETREETARRFTPQAMVGIYRLKHPWRDETYLRITFSGSADEPQAGHPLDDGILGNVWMTREELTGMAPERLRSNIVLRCIEDHLQGHRYPLDAVQDLA